MKVMKKVFSILYQGTRKKPSQQQNEEMIRTTIALPKKLHKELKIKCVNEGISQTAFISELIKKSLANE